MQVSEAFDLVQTLVCRGLSSSENCALAKSRGCYDKIIGFEALATV